MMLIALILITIVGAFSAWAGGRREPRFSRWISVVTLAVDAAVVLFLGLDTLGTAGEPARWLAEAQWAWIPRFGISLHLGMDGISFVLIALTVALGLMAVAASWTEITERVGFFYFNLLLVLAGIFGVFLALDLFLFYFFWEVMLVPMYFLIAIWGHEQRYYAALKFFLFTQAGGLLLLVAILALYFLEGQATGVYSFDYEVLLRHSLAPGTTLWLMAGFFLAFAVKLPLFPVHSWLPAAHTEAPTGGSVILAGLLLKTGGYGLIRFVVPMFPRASAEAATVILPLAVVGILYGAVLAFAQTDLKRLVAYTSVSHLGFVALGVFSGTQWGLQGAMLQMVCHGLSTGGLFVLAGLLQERLHTRDTDEMGGIWAAAPKMGAMGLALALASLGLPGLGNFIAEFLVLLGSYTVRPGLTVVAAVGLVLAAIYSLWIVQAVFHGARNGAPPIRDLTRREFALLSLPFAGLIYLGVYPQTTIELLQPAISGLLSLGEWS